MVNEEGGESEIRYTFIHEVEVVDPGPITVGQLYEIIENGGGADFQIAGAPNDDVGTVFEATGQPGPWGTGKLRLLPDADPLNATAYTIETFNPNWLLRSQEFTNAAWTKVANGSELDPRAISRWGSNRGLHSIDIWPIRQV